MIRNITLAQYIKAKHRILQLLELFKKYEAVESQLGGIGTATRQIFLKRQALTLANFFSEFHLLENIADNYEEGFAEYAESINFNKESVI